MRRWKYRIALKKEWKAAKNGEMDVEVLTKEIGKKIRVLLADNPTLNGMFIDGVTSTLESFSGDDLDEFDDIFDNLYNWADVHDVWVETVL